MKRLRARCTAAISGVALTLLSASLWLAPAAPALADEASQRRHFQTARQQLAKGQISQARGTMKRLQDYPLLPYLELTLLRDRLDSLPAAEVQQFMQRYPDSVPADQLRAQWLAALVRNKRWSDFLALYDPASAGDVQRCWHIEALHQTGETGRALDATTEAWLRPSSAPDACDKVFERWQAGGRRTQEMVWQRYALALQAGNVGIARYLSSELKEPRRSQARRGLELLKDAAALRRLRPQIERGPEAGLLLSVGLQRLARRDSDGAEKLWLQLRGKGLLSSEQNAAVREAIGRQRIARLGAEALPWLLEHDPHGEDDYLLEWRIRLALLSGDWVKADQWIGQLPQQELETSRWRYWRARAWSQLGDQRRAEQAGQLLASLAQERTFYGFLAADLLELPYQLHDTPLQPGISPREIARRPDLRRMREFWLLGERWSAQREWNRAQQAMNEEQKQAALLLVADWGWHHQVIRSATAAGAWNDLSLRFPLAYQGEITRAAKQTGLPAEWVYAIARQESAFIPDARSSAGAVGLLQLLPGTAREVARKARLQYSPARLTQPAHSARLGSEYLRTMLARYNGNRVLATAAYNAGPGRISRLLQEQQGQAPVDVWVENIPYRETRDYVQNVLAYAVIYAYRLGEKQPLLAAHEKVIRSPLEPALARGSEEDAN